MNARGFDKLARRRMLAVLLAVAPMSWQARAGAQEIEFAVGEPTEISDRSTVRSAVTPANRHRRSGAGQRAVVEFDAIEAEPQRVRPSATGRPDIARRPGASRPAVRAAASSQVIESTVLEGPEPIEAGGAAPLSAGPQNTTRSSATTPSPRGVEQHEVWSEQLPYPDHYAPPVVYEDAGYDGSGYGSACCDAGCGPGFNDSICNSPDTCGAPRFAFNPLLDPQSFGCGLLSRMQFRVAHSFFWTTDATLPVLATDGTDSLFGGGGLMQDSQSGIRFDATAWLDNSRQRALWLRMYDSGDHEDGFFGTSASNPVIDRPIVQFPGEFPTVVVVSSPTVDGTLDIDLRSSVEGGDLLVRQRLLEDELVRSDLMWGFQSVRFSEDLTIDSESMIRPIGPTLNTQDRFAASSQFNGGTVGYLRSARDGAWYFDGMVKFGLGNMNRTVNISGTELATAIDRTTDFRNQGLLARATNDGVFEDDTFVIVPELSATAGYLLTRNMHFTVSYTYLRLPKVTRVGDAIDTGVNPNPAPNPSRPAFNFAERHLNVQTLDLGLQYRY